MTYLAIGLFILLIYTMTEHGKGIKKITRLEAVLKTKTIIHEDYNRYIHKTADFYRYLANLRKKEPNGNVHIINDILNMYDLMLFDKPKINENDLHMVDCPICKKETKYMETKQGYKCTECGFEI